LLSLRKLLNQFIRFLFVSGTGWLIDFSLYFIFTNILKYEVFYSNILSSIPAITFVFIVSVKKIFKKKENGISIRKKYIIYFLYQMLLIFLISLLGQSLYLILVENNMEARIIKIIIKIIITPITMIINFFVMKFLTEKL
jgi:GtrA-like protein.